MSEPFDPDAYLAAKTGKAFDPDAYLEAKGMAIAAPEGQPPSRGSFLDYLKAKFSGETDATPDVGSLPGVRTVQTPTGPTHLDAQGRQVRTPEEAQQALDGGEAKFRQRILEGGLSTLSGGGTMMDELAGASAVGDPRSHRQGEAAGDTYRRVRDSTRRDVESATRNASPTVSVAGSELPVLPMAGAALPSLLAPNPLTWGGRILGGGLVGAGQAAASSEADLTRGDIDGFAKDTGRGAGVGLLASGVAEGLSVPMRAISRGAGQRIGDAVSTRAGQDVSAVGEELSSLRGQLGGESQKMSRMFENTQRAAGGGVAPMGQSAINPALQGRALLALSDPSTVRLQEKVLTRALDEMPGQAGAVTRLEQELAQRTAEAGQEAAQRTSNYFAQPVLETEVAPRLGRLAYNAGTGALAGGAAGAAMGMGSMLSGVGDPFTAAAVGLGTGLTQGLGKSAITMSRNAAASPLMQAGALSALSSTAQGGARGMQAGARAVTSVSGPAAQYAQKNAFDALAKRFGINAKSKEELANEAFIKGQTAP